MRFEVVYVWKFLPRRPIVEVKVPEDIFERVANRTFRFVKRSLDGRECSAEVEWRWVVKDGRNMLKKGYLDVEYNENCWTLDKVLEILERVLNGERVDGVEIWVWDGDWVKL